MRINNRTLLLGLAQQAIAAVRGKERVRAEVVQLSDWPALDVLAIGTNVRDIVVALKTG